MNRIKTGKWEFTEQEIARQLRDAAKRGDEAERSEARADRVYYDGNHRRLIIELVSGVLLGIPVNKIQGLANAAPSVIEEVRLEPSGDAVRWDRLDLDFGIPGLVAGALGTNAWMAELGRKGGIVQSEAKAAAARDNGRKGGRPAQVQTRFLTIKGIPQTKHLAFAANSVVNVGTSHLSAKDWKGCRNSVQAWLNAGDVCKTLLVGHILESANFADQVLLSGHGFYKKPDLQVPANAKEAANSEELALAA